MLIKRFLVYYNGLHYGYIRFVNEINMAPHSHGDIAIQSQLISVADALQ